jgi:hypothetical protein
LAVIDGQPKVIGQHGERLAVLIAAEAQGLFPGAVTLVLFCIASLNTYYLMSNVRVPVSAVNAHKDTSGEKPKRQADEHLDNALESENEMVKLQDLVSVQEHQPPAQHRP